MADGNSLDWPAGAAECVEILDAISRLEAGQAKPGLTVGLGHGHFARLEKGMTVQAFLARLKVHARLTALSDSLPKTGSACAPRVDVDPAAKALLDAVRKTR